MVLPGLPWPREGKKWEEGRRHQWAELCEQNSNSSIAHSAFWNSATSAPSVQEYIWAWKDQFGTLLLFKITFPTCARAAWSSSSTNRITAAASNLPEWQSSSREKIVKLFFWVWFSFFFLQAMWALRQTSRFLYCLEKSVSRKGSFTSEFP